MINIIVVKSLYVVIFLQETITYVVPHARRLECCSTYSGGRMLLYYPNDRAGGSCYCMVAIAYSVVLEAEVHYAVKVPGG